MSISNGRPSCVLAAVVAFPVIAAQMSLISPVALADAVRLANGDIVRGQVVSLNAEQLILQSENFGEMKIPRDKVALIGLGEQSVLPVAPAAGPAGGAGKGSAAEQLPSLQSSQLQQQLDGLLQQTLGGGGIGSLENMQQDLQKTRQGLKDLQKDLGPGPSADALEGYLKLFELFDRSAPAAEGPAPSQPENAQGSQPAPK